MPADSASPLGEPRPMPAATPMTAEVEIAIASLRAAVLDDNTLDEWFRPGYLLEVADMLTRLRSTPDRAEADDAALGKALRAAAERAIRAFEWAAVDSSTPNSIAQSAYEQRAAMAALRAALSTPPQARTP